MKPKTKTKASLAIVGVDIGKEVFHLVGLSTDGTIAFRRKIRRLSLKDVFEQLPPCVVGMEACLSVSRRAFSKIAISLHWWCARPKTGEYSLGSSFEIGFELLCLPAQIDCLAQEPALNQNIRFRHLGAVRQPRLVLRVGAPLFQKIRTLHNLRPTHCQASVILLTESLRSATYRPGSCYWERAHNGLVKNEPGDIRYEHCRCEPRNSDRRKFGDPAQR